jgi:DNA polymerase III epsilon subunit-like protein
VSEALGKPHNNVKQLMWKMGNDGDLRSVGGGKYVPITDNLDNHEEVYSLSEDDSAPSMRDNVRSNEESAAPGAVIPVTEVTVTGGLTDDREPPLISTRDQLESVVDELRSAEVIGLDLETTGLNPRTDRVRLISLSTAEGSWLIDCFEVDPHPLFEVLGQKKLLMHNGQFDLGFLSVMGFEIEEGGEVLDTMLLSQLLEDKEGT